MQEKDFEQLLERFHAGKASPEEKALIETWYLKFNGQANKIADEQLKADQEESLARLLKDIQPASTVKLWPRIAAAASVLIILSFGGYFYFKPSPQQVFVARHYHSDVPAGSNKAILTLANGKHLVLNDAKNGKLTNEAIKTGNGQLVYSESETEVSYNTLTTPRGGQYQVTLPDGSKVWLNAASTLKFPTSLAKLRQRQVELTGEAYFEVVHNSEAPFKVITGKQTVEDLGTHFNINSYDDAVKTTLTEGSIKINDSQILTPGQQASFIDNTLKVGQADIEEALAWKNGYFRFNNEVIRSIMPKLARWYDIEVIYTGKISNIGFYGTISRDKNISAVLAMLEQTRGVHFKIEGRRVTVIE